VKILIALSSLIIAYSMNISAQDNVKTDKEAIKETIANNYIEAAFNKGDAFALKKGMHYDCDILVFEKGSMRKVPAYSYVERLEKNPVPLAAGTTYEFTDIQVTGYAAMAIVEQFRANGNHVYTEYLSLYKFDDGWEIVSRIAYRHPENN